MKSFAQNVFIVTQSENKTSIDVSEVCNGVVNCDNGTDEDEQHCPVITEQSAFSSDKELIANSIFRVAFWIIGLVVITANATVIQNKARYLKSAKLTDSLRCRHTIILIIAFADSIIGIHLLATSVYSAIYSGYYGQVDLKWRSSLRCSIIGSLAVFFSEALCFLMVVLTAFRLNTTSNPFATLSSRMWPWKMSICGAWLTSFAMALLPFLQGKLEYFIHTVIFSMKFHKSDSWNTTSLTKFVCQYAAMTNRTIIPERSTWESNKRFLKTNFPNTTLRELGYYSETSICMPRFYVKRVDSSWVYTFTIMTLNFAAFISIAVCYCLLFYKYRKRSHLLDQGKSSKQELKMQKRIATLIATHFFCWIPICVMGFIRISGDEFSNLVHQFTAVFLLPVNSALKH